MIGLRELRVQGDSSSDLDFRMSFLGPACLGTWRAVLSSVENGRVLNGGRSWQTL